MKVKFANKQGRRPKNRITGSSRVCPILGFMTFRECCVFGLHLFWLTDSTCLNGLFSELRTKVTGKSEKKCDEIPSYIYQRLSQPKINLDSINFNIYSEISFVYEDETLLCQKNFSRFYSMFLNYVKCRTILGLTKKSDLDLRSDPKR